MALKNNFRDTLTSPELHQSFKPASVIYYWDFETFVRKFEDVIKNENLRLGLPAGHAENRKKQFARFTKLKH